MEVRLWILTGLMVLLISPLNAQRLLGGQKSVQISGAVPMNTIEQPFRNYGLQLAMTSNTEKGNYWKFGVGYQFKTFDYKKWQLPYDFYNGQIGYFLKTYGNYRKNILLFTGLSGLAGYEVFNNDTILLDDGATLKNKSQFLYGGVGTLSLELYLSNQWLLFTFSDVKYLPKSSVNQWQSQLGFGTRLFIN